MDEHRENLLKLIKMMKGVYNESIVDNYSREMSDDNSKKYISYERLLSIRELTRMFIEELNSEYLKCSEGDEIVGFIEDTIGWLQSAYDFTIENNAGSTGVKSLKVCSQSLNDYKKVYNNSEMKHVSKNGERFSFNYFWFGKKQKEQQYTSNTTQPITVNLSINGDNANIDDFTKSFEKYVKDTFNNLKSR